MHCICMSVERVYVCVCESAVGVSGMVSRSLYVEAKRALEVDDSINNNTNIIPFV